jgi:hypothetical protein
MTYKTKAIDWIIASCFPLQRYRMRPDRRPEGGNGSKLKLIPINRLWPLPPCSMQSAPPGLVAQRGRGPTIAR